VLVAQMIVRKGCPSQDVPPPLPPPPSAMVLCAPERLLIAGPGEGNRIDVIRKPDGSIGWLPSGGRIYWRVE
jgi:hypothetical protein